MLENCNAKKLAAKELQEQHSELHLANLIRKSGSIECKGIVFSVLDRAVDVVFLYLGLVRRLYLDVSVSFITFYKRYRTKVSFLLKRLPLKQLKHEKFNGIGKLTLEWEPETPTAPPVSQIISVFSLLEIELVPCTENNKLDFSLVLRRPSRID